VIYSIGHGNRSFEEFLALLREAGISTLVDVRTVPRSRKHPHFGRDELAPALSETGLRYFWEGPDLGGFRRPREGSAHTALRSPGFRNYADHMESAAFRSGVDRLLALAEEAPTAYLCAERLPWRCHRYLLSDYLVFRGARVLHLLAPGKSYAHRLNPLARAAGDTLVYDVSESPPTFP
jgi:uncharacterized protein (DUF488 family)